MKTSTIIGSSLLIFTCAICSCSKTHLDTPASPSITSYANNNAKSVNGDDTLPFLRFDSNTLQAVRFNNAMNHIAANFPIQHPTTPQERLTMLYAFERQLAEDPNSIPSIDDMVTMYAEIEAVWEV